MGADEGKVQLIFRKRGVSSRQEGPCYLAFPPCGWQAGGQAASSSDKDVTAGLQEFIVCLSAQAAPVDILMRGAPRPRRGEGKDHKCWV